MIGIFSFGSQSILRGLGIVNIKGAKQEDLCLCYKLSMLYLFIPWFLTRDGYVLGVITKRQGEKYWYSTKTFYPLPEADIQRFQTSGHLPNPMPTYQSTFKDWWPLLISWPLAILMLIGGLVG